MTGVDRLFLCRPGRSEGPVAWLRHASNDCLALNRPETARSPPKPPSSQLFRPRRRRLLLEVVEAVTAAVGTARVGIRLSPFNK